MNKLLEMGSRGYYELVSGDGAQTYTNAADEPVIGVVAVKAVNGAGAVVKVTNKYASSSSTAVDSGTDMVLLAGEIELVTATAITVVSGTIRAFRNSNPPT